MDFKTLKNVIDDTFSLKEEKVLFDNNFLENSAGSYIAYTTSLFLSTVIGAFTRMSFLVYY